MRLFHKGGSGHGLFGRGGPRIPRSEETIGSAIDTKDQFDILIPNNHRSGALTNWRFVERSDTMVSSITTEEIRLKPSQKATRTGSETSWCCCSSGTPRTTCTDTENTLLAPAITSKSNKKSSSGQQTQQRQEQEEDLGWSAWCNVMGDPVPTGDEAAPAIPPNYKNMPSATRPTSKQEYMAELNRNNSLFDPLSDEEDGPEVHATPGKKLRQNIRRALPWKLNRSHGGRGRQTPVSGGGQYYYNQQQPQAAMVHHRE